MAKATVLIVEDEPSVADALSIILSDNGYDVIVTMTGNSALEESARRRFDATITDLRLPDISGLDVLNRIRRENPESVVIVITAYSTPEAIAELLCRGAMTVLQKPFPPSEILDLVNAALKFIPRR